jgi:hypothetical protein
LKFCGGCCAGDLAERALCIPESGHLGQNIEAQKLVSSPFSGEFDMSYHNAVIRGTRIKVDRFLSGRVVVPSPFVRDLLRPGLMGAMHRSIAPESRLSPVDFLEDLLWK